MPAPLQHPTPTRSTERAPAINSVRGLACLLVVALHVVGVDASTGLHLPATSDWHYAMSSLDFIRMPLFTALSGYLYAGNRVTAPMFRRFWAGKLRRIAVPLLCLTGIVWLLRRTVYHDQTPLLEAFLFSYEHLWYLQALLVIFAAMSVWDVVYRPIAGTLLLVGLAAIMVDRSIPITALFSLGGALYLAPYFLFGIILRDQPEWLRDRQSGTIALGVILIVLATQQFGLNGLTPEITVMQLPAAIAGMAGVFFLLQRLPHNAALATVGRYAYTIYLWHVVAAAPARKALVAAGITNTFTLFAIIFLIGLATPIALHHIARRIPFISVAFTGERSIRISTPTPARSPDPSYQRSSARPHFSPIDYFSR